MSESSTPHSPVKVTSIDTPPATTSLHDQKSTIPSPPSPIIRTSNPTKFKRKLALTLQSLYDEDHTLQVKVRDEEKIELGSPLWGNETLECISGDDLTSVKDEEVRILENLRVQGIEDIEGDLVKVLTSSPEMIAISGSADKESEKVLEVALEPALTGIEESGPFDLDVTSPAIADPIEALGSASPTTLADTQMNEVPNTILEHPEEIKIRHEWTGTCQFDRITEISIDLQKEASSPPTFLFFLHRINSTNELTNQPTLPQNKLDNLILYRKALIHDMALAPHDPYFYIDLSQLDAKLAFSDTSSQYAYRALLLLQAGLQTITPAQSALSRSVFTAISSRLCTSSIPIIMDELNWMHVCAYRCLVRGLLHCAAFWDGLTVVKIALEEFPHDVELLHLRGNLLHSFRNRHEETIQDAKDANIRNIIASSRPGLIYQKKYPWMASKLFVRTPRLVRQVNSKFESSNAEVRPVVFGSPGTASTFKLLSSLPKHADVGPLGIFAKRDIAEGESILIDKSYACISDIAPSTGQFCDACHAALIPPFMFPSQIVRPSCGCKVSFCSEGCHNVAVKGYHKIQCGIDFSWLYNAGSHQTDWDPIMFLRVICIVLSTPGWSKDSIPQKNPLQHPLIARLTANYASNDKQATNGCNWSYQDNIVLPTRILLDLGIDIYTPVKKTHAGKTKLFANIWTPELIQTIYWRMLNNANTSTINISGLSIPIRSSTSPNSRFGQDTNAHLIVLSPNYIFFNHSCRNNVTWKGTCFNGSEYISMLISGEGKDQKVMKPGSSSVICKADRDITAGEELTISYLGDPMGDYSEGDYFENQRLAIGQAENGSMSSFRLEVRLALVKWFGGEDGCGCLQCVEENERGVMPRMERL
ncbi:a2d98197-90f5-4361-983f-9c74acac787e [Sclerotinia trifoliorum]|uniref:A2d98197-90f5-4361-983f-9c74acac787e n=1 Tax=Sclerotinia trifoliorum TaxID=28548 RepID=A0A8H2VYN3_9HELO|nr:a2d98197-90f5-4361-983f-9c74acac787e [Sclerotinia trifoliorum]